MKIATVVGARPQFVKAAAVSRVIAARNQQTPSASIHEVIIHTGQHFDDNMSEVFFRELGLAAPQHNLGVNARGHGAMTGRMLEALDPVLQAEEPDWVLVHGDTNSTLAGALAAAKLGLRLAHVEAGLRSFDRSMPEEINRVLTDHAAELLFAPTDAAVANLAREGLQGGRVVRTGDVMYDAFLHDRQRAAASSAIVASLDLTPGRYVLATVHRAQNTEDAGRLRGIVEGLAHIAASLPVVFPVHPRTRLALQRTGLESAAGDRLRFLEPVGYLDMLALEAAAALIATDSGGVQKEAYFQGVPCLTLREQSEWVELVELGATMLVGTEPARIRAGFEQMRGRKIESSNLYGDGQAAETIIDSLCARSSSARLPGTAPA